MTGLRTGLHYPALEAVMRLLGVAPEHTAQRFGEVQIMERAALAEFHRQLDADAARPRRPSRRGSP